ncbi:YdeI/OmpD-associated family protein [Geodermatophilus sp. URMC 63]
MRFRTTVELHGRSATGLPVPDAVVEALGAGRRPAVCVTLKGHTYRSTVASRGGSFVLPLSAENRAAAGVSAGDEVDVELALDTEPREVAVPADLAAALADDPQAARAFAALPYSHRQRHVLAVEGAKAAETRQRRIAAAVRMLREGS